MMGQSLMVKVVGDSLLGRAEGPRCWAGPGHSRLRCPLGPGHRHGQGTAQPGKALRPLPFLICLLRDLGDGSTQPKGSQKGLEGLWMFGKGVWGVGDILLSGYSWRQHHGKKWTDWVYGSTAGAVIKILGVFTMEWLYTAPGMLASDRFIFLSGGRKSLLRK